MINTYMSMFPLDLPKSNHSLIMNSASSIVINTCNPNY